LMKSRTLNLSLRKSFAIRGRGRTPTEPVSRSHSAQLELLLLCGPARNGSRRAHCHCGSFSASRRMMEAQRAHGGDLTE
jgi:hypothetical protein